MKITKVSVDVVEPGEPRAEELPGWGAEIDWAYAAKRTVETF